jgi:ankyrin repeat protein
VLCELGLDCNLQDAQGLTAMHWAADFGQVEVLHALYQLGADPSARDEVGQGPLHAAAKKGQLEALRVLKELGCDVHQVRCLW